MIDAIILFAFVGIAVSFDSLEQHLPKRVHVRRLAGALAIAVHPTTLHALHEFAVHVIVYSGYVLPVH